MIPAFLIVFIVSCIFTSVGFYKFAWFLSIGYGLSVAAQGVTLLVLFKSNLTFVSVVLSLLCVIYGVRLASFLYMRQKDSTFTSNVKPKTEKDPSIFVKIAMWLPVALLYVLEVSPALFRLQNNKAETIFGIIGIILSGTGVTLEGLADYQKSSFKKKNPKAFCNVGLYRFVQHPNYLGEVTFWLGQFVAGIPIYQGFLQWIAAISGFGLIALTMLSATSGLEKRQQKSYGDDADYRAYKQKTPILIPFIPVYSFGKN